MGFHNRNSTWNRNRLLQAYKDSASYALPMSGPAAKERKANFFSSSISWHDGGTLQQTAGACFALLTLVDDFEIPGRDPYEDALITFHSKDDFLKRYFLFG